MPLPLLCNLSQVLISGCLFGLLFLQGLTPAVTPAAALLLMVSLVAAFLQVLDLALRENSPRVGITLVTVSIAPMLINVGLMIDNVWHAHTGQLVSASSLTDSAIDVLFSVLCSIVYLHIWRRRSVNTSSIQGA